MRIGPCAIGAELISVRLGGAGIVEEPRFRIGVVERAADEGVVVNTILDAGGTADAVESEAVGRDGGLPVAIGSVAEHVERPWIERRPASAPWCRAFSRRRRRSSSPRRPEVSRKLSSLPNKVDAKPIAEFKPRSPCADSVSGALEAVDDVFAMIADPSDVRCMPSK